jgi:alkylhydroperoxidase family enzyme
LTERYYLDHHAVDDELWAELLAVFTEAEVVELTMSIGQNMAMGKLVAMLGIPNPDFRSHLGDETSG